MIIPSFLVAEKIAFDAEWCDEVEKAQAMRGQRRHQASPLRFLLRRLCQGLDLPCARSETTECGGGEDVLILPPLLLPRDVASRPASKSCSRSGLACEGASPEEGGGSGA